MVGNGRTIITDKEGEGGKRKHDVLEARSFNFATSTQRSF
jgi:hypothetical protein